MILTSGKYRFRMSSSEKIISLHQVLQTRLNNKNNSMSWVSEFYYKAARLDTLPNSNVCAIYLINTLRRQNDMIFYHGMKNKHLTNSNLYSSNPQPQYNPFPLPTVQTHSCCLMALTGHTCEMKGLLLSVFSLYGCLRILSFHVMAYCKALSCTELLNF